METRKTYLQEWEKTRLVLVGIDRRLRDGLQTAEGLVLEVVVQILPRHLASARRVLAGEPAAVLVDTSVGESRLLAVVRGLRRRRSAARILVVASAGDELAVRAIEAGASACLAREATLAESFRAIHAALRGETVCPPWLVYGAFRRLAALATADRRRDRLAALALTPREIEVLALIADGLSNRGIALQLSLSIHTVKHHVHHVLVKLAVPRRADAVRHARAKGWLRGRRRGDPRA